MIISDEDEIVFLIGKLYTNLQSLEFALRCALYEIKSSPHNSLKYGVSINSFVHGDSVPENSMTDYSSLGELINRYNNQIANDDPEKIINNDIVNVRNALAHGRLSSNKWNEDATLIKFTSPKNSLVKVSFSQRLTKNWLKQEINLIYSEALKVVKTSRLDQNRGI